MHPHADERLSNIVVMGMGEPLAKFEKSAPRAGNCRQSARAGNRRPANQISTVGLPPAIDRLAELNSHYHLAVSLHAPNDELRNQLVPVNSKIGVQPILQAADRYFKTSGRRLTFEYVLLGGINDQPQHARQLAALLRGRTALLNVIPYNPVAGLPYVTPSGAALKTFLEILERGHINVQVRQRKGDKIDAACGQLRRSQLGSTPDGLVQVTL